MKPLLAFTISLLVGCTQHAVPPEFWLDVEQTLPSKPKPRLLKKGTRWGDLPGEIIELNREKAESGVRVEATKDKLNVLRETF